LKMKKNIILIVIVAFIISLCLVLFVVIKKDISEDLNMKEGQINTLDNNVYYYDDEKVKLKEKFINDSIDNALEKHEFETEEEKERYREILKKGIESYE